ncbi:glycosyltransferase [Streptomyces lavendulae]|uniref:glycosyltransferase n=1 Tax=Streptomyces lavendulae TaxID=1914 RepID=UPI0031E86854
MKPIICLCMIVKNESAVIERCLASVRDHIDTWVISDTGSTDGTQQLIRAALDGIPGELHEEPWTDFGHNRSLNIAHARGRADYLLLLDADLVLRADAPLPPLVADSYMLRHEGPTEYRIKRLVSGRLPWRYEGVTHEYITCDRSDTVAHLDALAIEDHGDGGSKHASMGGWGEEVYHSLLQVGVLYGDSGDPADWPAAMDAFDRAWESRPERLEACYELVSRLRLLGRYHSAHAIVRACLDRPVPDDVLFIQPWVYRWGLLFEYSITAFWVGDLAACLQACDRLLALPDLPASYRRQTELNRGFALQRLSVPAQA